MVSKLSLTTSKTSPPLVDSPTAASMFESGHDIGSPASHTEPLSIRKRRFGFDGIMKGDARGTDLQGIAEETSNSSLDDMTIKLSSASQASSISKRRGFRPLSVRIGEAFSPFSSRDGKHNRTEPMDRLTESADGDPQDLWRRLELSKKVNWTENVDPHIFNANFVASLTSKRTHASALDVMKHLTDLDIAAPDVEDHPVFRADPFSVQTPEPLLQLSIPSELALVPQTSSGSKLAVPHQTASSNIQDVEKVMTDLGFVDSKATPSQKSTSTKTNSGAASHLHNSSPLSNRSSEQAPSADRRGSTSTGVSHSHKSVGTPDSGVLPPSPSFSRYNSRTSSERGRTIAKIFGSASLTDEATDGKRARGLSNLFKTRLASISSSKGEVTSNHSHVCKTNIV
jgi:hypothetical protein